MKLTSKTRYAMRAMVFLAECGESAPQPLSRIAQCGMPVNYLEQLLGTLRKHGLVRTVRGNQGGYLLARSAGDITLLDIITAVEGPIKKSLCYTNTGVCSKQENCGVNKAWEKVTSGIEQVINRVSLSDMVTGS
ncbi:MAG: Rrf2 family transcriptional regulator [Bacillota bacterium]|nr:Rrf2 family transcriptional regulator [Bacillota bacterium]